MKKYLKYIIFVTILIILTIVILLILKSSKKEETTIADENTNRQEEIIQKEEEQENDVMVVGIEPKEEEVQVKEKAKKETVKDAATLTQEIYNINGTIGTLYIPKTRSKYPNL